MAWEIPWSVIAATVSGDFGPVTVYTDRNQQKVVFPRSPPDKPPSTLQTVQRSRFRSAVAAYMALTAADKYDWEQITLKSSCCLTGQNLFIKIALTRQYQALETLRRQTGIQVSNPPTL